MKRTKKKISINTKQRSRMGSHVLQNTYFKKQDRLDKVTRLKKIEQESMDEIKYTYFILFHFLNLRFSIQRVISGQSIKVFFHLYPRKIELISTDSFVWEHMNYCL